MPFPHSKRVIFDKNPLREVICQLRFPTILEIGVEPPARFQNLIRSTYSLYSREDVSQSLPKEISSLLEQLRFPFPGQAQGTTHKFGTEHETRFISLSAEFIAVTEREYHRWELFVQEVEKAQGALEEVYRPAFYARVGLRYQDVIDRELLGLDKPWSALINPCLAGMLGSKELSQDIREIETESLIIVPEVRGGFVRLRHGLRKAADNGRLVYVIDSDFYTRERSDRNEVIGILDRFRRSAGDLFRWAASSDLQRALNPKEID